MQHLEGNKLLDDDYALDTGEHQAQYFHTIVEDKKPRNRAILLAWIALTLIGVVIFLLRHRGIIQ